MKKKILFTLLLCVVVHWAYAQTGVFKSGFVFRKDRFNKLYGVKKDGKIDTSQQRVIKNKLIGVVKERNEDTLSIVFWPLIDDEGLGQTVQGIKIIDSTDNKKKFYFLVKDGWKGKRRHFDVPYRFSQLIATNIPFRVFIGGSKPGNVESEFLNANVSYVLVKGSLRIYESDLVAPRPRYWAFGPYLGLTAITNPDKTDRKEFGVNGGINLVAGTQGVNAVIALGAQSGFTRATNDMQWYFGLGIGFKIFELFSPEIKNKKEG